MSEENDCIIIGEEEEQVNNENRNPFVEFLVEKTKSVKVPISVRSLCRDFIEESDCSQSENQLRRRINVIRNKIHKLKNTDMDTKVKMLFALSASVDNRFLNEMKEVATVELDKCHRIVKFTKKDGGLQLSGSHNGYQAIVKNDNDEIALKYLADLAENVTRPILDEAFIQGLHKSGEHVKFGLDRYRFFKKHIYTFIEFDKMTRIKMLFVSSAMIQKCDLEELREDAFVCVDKNGRLIKYVANDKSLKLLGGHNKEAKEAATIDEQNKDIEMEKDTGDIKCEDYNSDAKRRRLEDTVTDIMRTESTEYVNLSIILESFRSLILTLGLKELDGTCKTIEAVIERVKIEERVISTTKVRHTFESLYIRLLNTGTKLGENMTSLKELLLLFKITMISLDIPVFNLLTDLKQMLEKLSREDKKMTMRVVNYRTRREFENDRNELFHFVAEKSKTATSPLVINRLCKEYIEENGTPRRMTSLRQTVYLLRDRIQHMEEFDKDTKVKIMIALGTQVDKEYLEELHRDADIRFDKQGRILEYKLKDVDLHLSADHTTHNIDKLGNENQESCTTVETAEKNDTTLNKTAIKKHGEENSFINEEKGSPALKKRRLLSVAPRDLEPVPLSKVRSSRDVQDSDRTIALEGEREMGPIPNQEQNEKVIDPLTINQMILEYKKINGTEKDINVFKRRIRVYRSNIHNRKDLNLETKAKQLFALGASLSTKFIKELEKEGIVKTDNKKRITKYIAKDGSLKLEGDHSFSSKIRANWVTRKKNSQGLNGVENNEIENETESKKSKV